MSFFSLLAVIFVVLKIVGVAPVAAWSWIWVLSPLWGGFLFWGVWFLFWGLVAALVDNK
jgi:hypothetical protein